MPMAANVPTTVATSEDTTAMLKVTQMLSKMSGLVNSFLYQSKVNPDHLVMDFPSLNEKIISIRMGR